MGRSHDAALFDRVVEQRQGGGGAGRRTFQPHFLKNVGHRIAHRGVGARERSTMPKGTHSRREASFATSCPMRVILKAVFLTMFATSVRSPRPPFGAGARTTPGPDTPVDDAVGLARTVEGPSHKGVVLRRVTEDHQLGGAHTLAVGRRTRRFAANRVPSCHSVHMLMPLLVVPMLTEEQTWSVTFKPRECFQSARSRRGRSPLHQSRIAALS